MSADWAEQYQGAITVCDQQGIILYMNATAQRVLADNQNLIGENVLDCHPSQPEASYQLCSLPGKATLTLLKRMEFVNLSTRLLGTRTGNIGG